MANDTLSQQDIQDLVAIRAKLPQGDPRADKIDQLLFKQAPLQYPNPVEQSRAQMASTVQPIAPTPFGLAPDTPEQAAMMARARPQIPQAVTDVRSMALAIGGAGIGAKLGGAAKG